MRSLTLGVAAATALLSLATAVPARAEPYHDRGGGLRHGEGHDGAWRRDRHAWRERHAYPPGYYAPPPVYYAPPPRYYTPGPPVVYGPPGFRYGGSIY